MGTFRRIFGVGGREILELDRLFANRIFCLHKIVGR